MGVPAFYRWLSERYPKIIVDCVEAEQEWVEGVEVPVDTSLPNPNDMEFDNLYLDMNNIIHPCFHPEDRPAPTTETEVFLAMFDYMDRLFAIVRPRKLLYMAIDGVAPRAKMNQQRSRRFRAAQEREEAAKEEARLRADMAKQGIKLPEKGDGGHAWDSNTITPGTPFMHRASVALQYYIHLRLNSDPGWRNITVMLSDSNSPGEGEHKIMSYVREQRGRPGWSPDTRHCLYGLDADLIMLGLATHEPHFVILREIIMQPQRDSKDTRAQMLMRDDPSAPTPVQKPQIAKKPYQFLLISALREYLTLEFEPPQPLAFPYDPERIIDDFVFMCFFVGNDFLPHMPTLEIREGAIDLLMSVYREELPRLGGYLTQGAKVCLDKVEAFIQTVGRFEDAIFQKRARLLAAQKGRRERDKARAEQMKANRGGRGGGRGRAPGKWTAAAPSEEYRQSLFGADATSGHGRRSPPPALPPGIPPPPVLPVPEAPAPQPSIPLPAPPPGLPNGAAHGHNAPPPAENGVPDGTPPAAAAADAAPATGSNQSAAQLLRARMRASVKRPSPEGLEDVPAAAADEEAPAKKLRTMQPDDDDAAAAAAGAAGEAAAAAEPVATADMQQPAVGDEAAGPDVALAAVKVEDSAVTELVQASAEVPQSDVKMEIEAEAAQASALDAVSAEAEQIKAEEGLAAGQPDEAEQLDEAGQDDEDEEVERYMKEEEEEALTELEQELALAKASAAAEEAAEAERKAEADLKAAMAATLKEKGDSFDLMVESESRIRLGEEGWKERYYQEKTGLTGPDQAEEVARMVKAYVEGLCWVMAYYYDGVASWTWFYPFHYAPFASDLRGLPQLGISFQLGEPFKPFNQLMGVLPAGSSHALPAAYQPLFTDADSPILDFYPSDFAIDMNGKRFAWQAVALLPFIDEKRLLAAVEPLEETLTSEEKYRNDKRCELLFMGSWHPLAPDILTMAEEHAGVEIEKRATISAPMDPKLTRGMNGALLLTGGEACPAVVPAPFDLGPDLSTNAVVAAGFRLPPHHLHAPRLLEGHVPEPKRIEHADLPPPKPLWHDDNRGRRGFHHEREDRGLTGFGAARAPTGPPSHLGPEGFRMLQHSMGGAAVPPPMQLYGQQGGAPPHGFPPRPGPRPPYANGGGYPGARGQQYGGAPPAQQPPPAGAYGGARPGAGPYGSGGYGGRGGGGGGFAPIAAQQPRFLDAAPGAYSGGRPRPGAGVALGALRPPPHQHSGAFQQRPPAQYGQAPPLQYGAPQQQPQRYDQPPNGAFVPYGQPGVRPQPGLRPQGGYGRPPAQYGGGRGPPPQQQQYGAAPQQQQQYPQQQYAPSPQQQPYGGGAPQQPPAAAAVFDANPFAPLVRQAMPGGGSGYPSIQGGGGARRDPRSQR